MKVSVMEKRRHVCMPVDVRYRLFIDHEEYSGRINNISSSGAYLATIDPMLPSGCVAQRGMLNLNIDADEWITAPCEIVYVGEAVGSLSPPGVGVSVWW
ncbi:MAG: PilZ domain-containing protein [Gammaproteobacteria bacterium]